VKNKYVNHAHFSEAKFREVLKLFVVADINVTQIAKISNLNRNTINSLVQRMRKRIEELAEMESVFSAGEIEVDESYFGASSGGKTKVFGDCKRKA